MATYFHGAPEIQQDGLQTLYLMNPSYEGYSDGAPPPSGMVYLNPAANSLNSIPITQNFQSSNQQHHLVGIPLQPMMSSHDSGHPSSIPTSQQVTAVHGFAPRLHYNLWTPAPSNNPIELPSPSQQGLSLSLSPHQAPYVPYKPEAEFPATPPEVKVMGSSSSSTMSGLNSVLMGSKYLKAAQLLLDEVVSVGNGTQGGSSKRSVSKSQTKRISEAEGVDQVGTSEKGGANLTTADRQELQTKKAKLVGMLDEVEQRYQHYRQQMQILVSSFEAVAGFGSARTYTALALQTISKQFQCLREAISGQIRATSKSLGEEDFGAGGTKSTVSRLRFVDHQLRQQRAIQQLGMIQHNAWRPQRGLPERAVSVLRAWLFEHFLHPYPKDADKHMLARQTGLTRGQVSNWFINARVRLWKPMVEEMYMEEFKDQEQSNADGSASKSDANEDSSANHERSPTRTEQTVSLELESEQNNPNDPIAPASSSITTPPSLKKTRWDHSASLEMKPDMNNRDFLMKFMEGGSRGGTTNHDGGFGAYSIGEVRRFDHEQFAPRYSTNGVSLTLGLPHSENLSLSGAQPPYLPTESIQLGRRLDMSSDLNDYNPATSHPPNAYDSLNIQNRKRFSSLLLPDFIA